MALSRLASLGLIGVTTLVAGRSSGSEGAESPPPASSRPSEKQTPSVKVPAGARVIHRGANRGENPSADFELSSLKLPLKPLYIRIKTQPPADINVNGSILCQDINSSSSVESDLPLSDGRGELVVRVPIPRGVRKGMDCTPIFAGSASTDPGKITLVTSELLEAPQ